MSDFVGLVEQQVAEAKAKKLAIALGLDLCKMAPFNRAVRITSRVARVIYRLETPRQQDIEVSKAISYCCASSR